MEKIIDSLNEKEKTLIENKKFDFGGEVGKSAVINENFIRFSFNLFVNHAYHPVQGGPGRYSMLESDNLIFKIKEIFDKEATRIYLEPGSAIIWNNHTCLHGRESFSQVDRKLKRCAIY